MSLKIKKEKKVKIILDSKEAESLKEISEHIIKDSETVGFGNTYPKDQVELLKSIHDKL